MAIPAAAVKQRALAVRRFNHQSAFIAQRNRRRELIVAAIEDGDDRVRSEVRLPLAIAPVTVPKTATPPSSTRYTFDGGFTSADQPFSGRSCRLQRRR
jgi:hypothetical protein